MNALASITDSLDASYTASVTCDANGNITGVSEMVIQFTYAAVLSSSFTYDALNRLTRVSTSQVKTAGGTQYTEYTNRRHRYDGLGRVADSALTVWTSGSEPTPAYRDHLYAGARHIGNADSGGTTYGARWHWAGSQFEYASPLNSPNADTAGQKGYNIARAQSPQQATWATPTAAGDNKLLYGQGRPMAKSASGAGASMSSGTLSKDQGSGSVQVSSRLFFDGTVAGGGTANDLSRMTDAREKGRIGILGSGLSYAGSYGRVTSESIGRDLNPLGTGAGTAAVGGGLNLGVIAPTLPGNSAFNGSSGNSANYGGPLGTQGGFGSTGTGCGSGSCSTGTGSSSSSGKNGDGGGDCDGPCHGITAKSQEWCNGVKDGYFRVNNCFGLTMSTNPLTIDCQECLVPWQEEWCKDSPDYGKYTGLGGGTDGGFGPGGISGGSGGSGGGGTTGPWGPQQEPPKPAISGGYPPAAPGDWSLIQGMVGGGNGRGGMFGPGAYQLLKDTYIGPAGPGNGCSSGTCNAAGKSYAYGVCCKDCGHVCSSDDCEWLEGVIHNAYNDFQSYNDQMFAVSLFAGLGVFMLCGWGGLIPGSITIAIIWGLTTGLFLGNYLNYKNLIKRNLNRWCYECIRKGKFDDTNDEVQAYSWGLLGFLPGLLLPGGLGLVGSSLGSFGSWWVHTNPWEEWINGPDNEQLY